MLNSENIKQFTISYGADMCGIASVSRFNETPKGFNPLDIYKNCRSVIVFLKQMPSETVQSCNPVPYTRTAYLLYEELDRLGLQLCIYLQKSGYIGILVPADTPYIYWDEEKKHGQGILSLRHAAQLAGLGILGRNTLLINPELGNMVYIGAVLTDVELVPDPLLKNLECPPGCRICLETCPCTALDGTTVNQKLCREYSFYQNERGFDIYDCNICRKLCPLRTGK